LPAKHQVDNIFNRAPNLIFQSEDMQEMILRRMLLFGAVLSLAAVAVAQGNRGAAEVTIKGKKISIDYGRPHLGGHGVSELPAGAVWRLGMNEATRIETAGDLGIGSQTLKAGKYTVWVKRAGENGWILAFHPKTEGQNGRRLWGEPAMTEGFVGELPLKLEKAKDSADQVTISLAEAKGKGWIKIQWGTDLLIGSFDVK
jgi:hypothetical protein